MHAVSVIDNMLSVIPLSQARPLLNRAVDEREFEELVDPRLENNYDAVEMFRVIEAAAACIRHSAVRRPKMGQVLTETLYQIWQQR